MCSASATRVGYHSWSNGCRLCAVWTLVRTFIDIALYRRGPEELPASRFLFAMVLLCNLLVGIVSVSIAGTLADALLEVGFYALVFLAFVAATLSLFGKLRRFYQTTTAYAGADTIISLLGLPLVFWISHSQSEDARVLAARLYLLLLVWSLAVFSYILSRSLEVSHWIAAIMVIAFFLFSYNLSYVIFSPPT